MAKGLIVYFDGPDGVGKTTQLKLAEEALKTIGHAVYATRTLGGTDIGEKLREVVLLDIPRPAATDMHVTMASQYALAEDVLKRCGRGEIVLIDRSPLSIVGYQVYGDGLAKEKGYNAAQELLNVFMPDLIITYFLDEIKWQARRQNRDHAERHNYFENKPVDYHRQVAAGFREAAAHFGAQTIDASGTQDEIHQATMTLIQKKLA